MNNVEVLVAVEDAASIQPQTRTGIERVDRLVYVLDDLIRIPIINRRVGIDPLIGLIPWAGDAFTTVLGMYIIGSAVYYRLPKLVMVRMGLNIIIDAVVGMIPVVGDAADFFIKSNRWNLKLLRQYADVRRQPGLSDYLFVGLILSVIVAVIALFVWFIGASLWAGFRFLRTIPLY
jgi:Domain of unknown function (DUF4112)